MLTVLRGAVCKPGGYLVPEWLPAAALGLRHPALADTGQSRAAGRRAAAGRGLTLEASETDRGSCWASVAGIPCCWKFGLHQVKALESCFHVVGVPEMSKIKIQNV